MEAEDQSLLPWKKKKKEKRGESTQKCLLSSRHNDTNVLTPVTTHGSVLPTDVLQQQDHQNGSHPVLKEDSPAQLGTQSQKTQKTQTHYVPINTRTTLAPGNTQEQGAWVMEDLGGQSIGYRQLERKERQRLWMSLNGEDCCVGRPGFSLSTNHSLSHLFHANEPNSN